MASAPSLRLHHLEILSPKVASFKWGQVALVDTIWRGKRDGELEEQVVTHLLGEVWEMLLGLDEIVEPIAGRGEERLGWQLQD